MPRRDLSPARVLAIYFLGVVAGVQGALYLYDTFDDGVSEPLSGGIALAFLAAGLGFFVWSFRRPRDGRRSGGGPP